MTVIDRELEDQNRWNDVRAFSFKIPNLWIRESSLKPFTYAPFFLLEVAYNLFCGHML